MIVTPNLSRANRMPQRTVTQFEPPSEFGMKLSKNLPTIDENGQSDHEEAFGASIENFNQPTEEQLFNIGK